MIQAKAMPVQPLLHETVTLIMWVKYALQTMLDISHL